MATNKFEKTPEGVTTHLVGFDVNGYMKSEKTDTFLREGGIVGSDSLTVEREVPDGPLVVSVKQDILDTVEASKVVDDLKALAFKDKVLPEEIDAIGDRNSGTFLSGDGTFRTPAGGGDMLESVYDPDGLHADAFSLGNMKETNEAKLFSATEKTKLAGIEVEATKNSTDAFLLDRANHTGTQLLSTISDAGDLAALNDITMSRVTDAGTLATKDSILLSDVTDAGLLAAKDDIDVSLVRGSSVLAGWRNKIINGNYEPELWQRGVSQTSSGYGSADRWNNIHGGGTTKTVTKQDFAGNYGIVPGSPRCFSRTTVVSGNAAGSFAYKRQPIEQTETLAGSLVTFTIYAKADVAGLKLGTQLLQYFGEGGSPSPVVYTGRTVHTLSTSWQKYQVVVELPSVAGKTFGTTSRGYLGADIWFDAGVSVAGSPAVGNQSGTFDVARISLVEGDATTEDDPFSSRHIQQELALCQRYFQRFTLVELTDVTGSAQPVILLPVPMRAVPTVAAYNGTGSWTPFGTKTTIRQGTSASTFGAADISLDSEL